MMRVSLKHLFVVQIALLANKVLLPHLSCFHLDITQKQNYATFGKNVTVRRLEQNERVYNHSFQEPTLLSDIVERGESVLFDKLFFREQPVSHATVIWANENPSVVHLYTPLATVVLLSNGNGRFFEQSVLSDVFVTNPSEQAHPASARQVTLELSRSGNYSAAGVAVAVTPVHKFDERLAPFTVHYQNVDQFRLGGLKFNDAGLGVPLSDSVRGVYVYSRDGSPLLVELVSSTSNHDYYVLTPANTWEQVLFPNIFDPLYNHYFVKKLNSLTSGCNNTFVLDIDKNRMGLHPVQVHCVVKGVSKTFNKVLKGEKGLIESHTWYRDSMDKLVYRLDPKAPFTLSSITTGRRTLNIALPPGPYTSITIYHFKCPIIIHFHGPNTDSYFEFVKNQPFKLFRQGAPGRGEISAKIKAIVDRYHMMSVLFSW